MKRHGRKATMNLELTDAGKTEPGTVAVLTCKGNEENIPYCAGVDCPDWGDCHGDRLRGYTVIDWGGIGRYV